MTAVRSADGGVFQAGKPGLAKPRLPQHLSFWEGDVLMCSSGILLPFIPDPLRRIGSETRLQVITDSGFVRPSDEPLKHQFNVMAIKEHDGVDQERRIYPVVPNVFYSEARRKPIPMSADVLRIVRNKEGAIGASAARIKLEHPISPPQRGEHALLHPLRDAYEAAGHTRIVTPSIRRYFHTRNILNMETNCCRLNQTTITMAGNRARKSTQCAVSGVESWSPRGVQMPKRRPVASTGVHKASC